MAGTLKHAKTSGKAAPTDTTKVGGPDWDADHNFAGGALGSLLYRDTGATDGANWLADVATGSVLVSGGVGAAPAWSATPGLTGVTFTAPSTGIATLGAELLDGTGWTSTGWSGSFNSFTHTGGNTSPLSRPIAGITAGQFYHVVVTITGSTTGTLTLSIGGTTVDNPDGATITGNGSFRAAPQTTSSGDFIVTPSSAFDGTVALSVKLVTPGSESSIVLKDSSGSVTSVISNSTASQNNLAIGGRSSIVGYVGGGSLSYVTTGSFNTAFGPNAPLASNTTGTYNTAIGGGALRANTTGWYNTAVGDDAMAFNTTGYDNSALGVDALYQNTTGARNVAVGFAALIANTTGSSNTSVGSETLKANVSGGSNVAVGGLALSKSTTSNNVAVGASALLNQTSGASNTAVGQQALTSLGSGSNNTGVGVNAGFAHAGAQQCTYVGGAAGYTETPANANVSGNNNTYVGYQAGPGTATQLANATGLGMQAHPIASNTVVIGNGSVTDVYFGSATPAAKAHALLFQTETALVALGGGASATFGTIGGSGPVTAAQNSWLKALDSTGATIWIPVWK